MTNSETRTVHDPMSETHTPGPWHYDRSEYADWGWVRDGGGRMVAHVRSFTQLPNDTLAEHRRNKTDPCAANAHLIASAPDLYEALEPFAKAAEIYLATLANFTVSGETMADRRASEGERMDTARDAAWDHLAALGPDAILAARSALSRARGEQT